MLLERRQPSRRRRVNEQCPLSHSPRQQRLNQRIPHEHQRLGRVDEEHISLQLRVEVLRLRLVERLPPHKVNV